MFCKFCATPTNSKKAICENCKKSNLTKNGFDKNKLKLAGFVTVVFLSILTVYVGYSEVKEKRTANLQLANENSPGPVATDLKNSVEVETSPEPKETLLQEANEESQDLVVPFESITLDSLPMANADTVAYDIGEQQALEWMTTGSLRQIWYATAANDAREFCKNSILGTYMGYFGGQSTLQEYANFIEGCTPVVDFWLSNE